MSANYRIPSCFSPQYCVPTRAGGLQKLCSVARAAQASHCATLIDPGTICIHDLDTLHDPRYVQAFLEGEKPLAISQNLPWSPDLRTAILAMQAGQLTAVQWALSNGIAANIANGFHHARYSRGGGFCTFNGLALIAHKRPDLRVFVLDCDEHSGDGTEEFSHWLPNLFNYTIFGTRFRCCGGVRSVLAPLPKPPDQFTGYTHALEKAFTAALEWTPDLIIYQAGVDGHRDDPLGKGLAGEQDLIDRDKRVFEFCRENAIPILFTLAGGYQAIERLTALHVNTFQSAAAVWSKSSSANPVSAYRQRSS